MEVFLIALFIIFMQWVLLELISFVLMFLTSSFKIINQCLLNQTGTNHQFVLVVLTSSYVLKTMTNHLRNQSHNFEVAIWGPGSPRVKGLIGYRDSDSKMKTKTQAKVLNVVAQILRRQEHREKVLNVVA